MIVTQTRFDLRAEQSKAKTIISTARHAFAIRTPQAHRHRKSSAF